MKTHYTFCRICEALCGLEVTVDGDRIVKVRPDKDHVTTRGFACPKGLHQHELYASPDRLTAPLKRTARGFVEASWDEALFDIGRRVKHLRAVDGPDAVGVYVGSSAGFSMLHPFAASAFATGLGSKSLYGPATQDCANKFYVAQHVYGFPFTQPFPDVARTHCLIVVGANPAMSKFSFLHLPDWKGQLAAIEGRGGRVFWIDPRRTESAGALGEHVFIRPGTDVFFYAAFLQALIAAGGIDRARVERHMDGFETVAKAVAPWTPERSAEATGITPDTLRRLVSAYQQAGGAALYCSTGVNMGPAGSLAFWLQEVINAASGNLDRLGGTLVGRGILDMAKHGTKAGLLMRTARSRVGGFQSVNDCFPGGILADEILTPGAGQLKGLFVSGGNPLLSMANAGRLREAFSQLDLLVSIDIQRNATAELAHWVLPATAPFERADLPFIFPLILGIQARPYLQATRALIPPPGSARQEHEIYAALARACGVRLQGSRVLQAILEAGADWTRSGHPLAPIAPTAERLFSGLLLACRQPSFKRLVERHPHGRLRPDHRGGDFLGKRVTTPNRRVQLAPGPLVEAAQGLDALFESERSDHRLRLITKRVPRTHNSWTHNVPALLSGERATNHLFVHPDDAARLGLAEGDLADVRSDTAAVRVPVRLLDSLMPGTVALPHGWGHQHAPGLRVARKTKGVNVNLLAADGPDGIEALSGMARLTAIPVEVEKAAGPAGDTWSGLPDAS